VTTASTTSCDALDLASRCSTPPTLTAQHNETLVGQAIAGRRAEVFRATKFGNLGCRGGKYADGRPEIVASSCDASLERLGIEVIDLYYQHRIDPTVLVEETVGAMAKLVEQGKVRFLGLSEAGRRRSGAPTGFT
jgi:aryl-alcohol dehydrogenase-like predicted oxidoreductase